MQPLTQPLNFPILHFQEEFMHLSGCRLGIPTLLPDLIEMINNGHDQ